MCCAPGAAPAHAGCYIIRPFFCAQAPALRRRHPGHAHHQQRQEPALHRRRKLRAAHHRNGGGGAHDDAGVYGEEVAPPPARDRCVRARTTAGTGSWVGWEGVMTRPVALGHPSPGRNSGGRALGDAPGRDPPNESFACRAGRRRRAAHGEAVCHRGQLCSAGGGAPDRRRCGSVRCSAAIHPAAHAAKPRAIPGGLRVPHYSVSAHAEACMPVVLRQTTSKCSNKVQTPARAGIATTW